MRARRPTPLRGLLAGLLALIVFASVAVAMTAGGSSSGSSQVLSAQSVVAGADGETRGAQRLHDDRTRLAVQRDGDGDGDDELPGGRAGHHR